MDLNHDGRNGLGKLWMKLREELRLGKIPMLAEPDHNR